MKKIFTIVVLCFIAVLNFNAYGEEYERVTIGQYVYIIVDGIWYDPVTAQEMINWKNRKKQEREEITYVDRAEREHKTKQVLSMGFSAELGWVENGFNAGCVLQDCRAEFGMMFNCLNKNVNGSPKDWSMLFQLGAIPVDIHRYSLSIGGIVGISDHYNGSVVCQYHNHNKDDIQYCPCKIYQSDQRTALGAYIRNIIWVYDGSHRYGISNITGWTNTNGWFCSIGFAFNGILKELGNN